MSRLSPFIGGTRRLVLHAGQYGLLLGPVRRALIEPAAAAHDEVLRLLICYYGERLWAAGLIAGTCGNLSARLRDHETVYITPRSANKSRLNAPDIVRVSLRAGPHSAGRASVELPMHRACYLASPNVGAVIHTHAPALTGLGLRDVDIEELLPEAANALGKTARIEYAPSGSEKLGGMVADAVVDGATLILLERHGAVSVGHNLAEAYERMELGELTAKAALLGSDDGRRAAARLTTNREG
ncbi:MAG: class II aldolase/adducin family protein [Gemmatimonadota bacterium]|nr:MAG: class II aldolase/adducin family protein [Gemmatimonadota bacterium]